MTRRRGRALRALLALGSASMLAGVAPPLLGATVEGTVRAVRPRPPVGDPLTMYPRYGLEGPHAHKPAVRDPGCNCVVYLEGAPPDGPPAAPDTLTMKQVDEQFVPHVLPVRVGSVVRFPNFDPFFHNVFSYSKAKRFDLGKYPTGRSRSVRFTRPGVIQVFCEIHEFMSAYILVLPHSHFASPAADGRFTLDGVPPGRYRLTVWSPGGAEAQQPLTVPDDERTVHVGIDL